MHSQFTIYLRNKISVPKPCDGCIGRWLDSLECLDDIARPNLVFNRLWLGYGPLTASSAYCAKIFTEVGKYRDCILCMPSCPLRLRVVATTYNASHFHWRYAELISSKFWGKYWAYTSQNIKQIYFPIHSLYFWENFFQQEAYRQTWK